ncbi:hypothetical protein D3C86_1930990 [compost metagenome]
MFGKGLPGVIAQSFAVGVEHDAGDHEFDPRRAVNQPVTQRLLLVCVEHASVGRRQIATGSTVGDKPFDIAVGEWIPILIELLV